MQGLQVKIDSNTYKAFFLPNTQVWESRQIISNSLLSLFSFIYGIKIFLCLVFWCVCVFVCDVWVVVYQNTQAREFWEVRGYVVALEASFFTLPEQLC